MKFFRIRKEEFETDVYIGGLSIRYIFKDPSDGISKMNLLSVNFWRNFGSGISLFSISEGKFQLGTDMRIIKNRIFNFWKLKKIKKEISRLEEECELICNDPMNGCPEDFAAEWGKRINKKEWEYEQIMYA